MNVNQYIGNVYVDKVPEFCTISPTIFDKTDFILLRYKIGLIRILIDRVFKINNSWLGFHKDIVKFVFILGKNLFPVHLIDKCGHLYLNTAIDRTGSTQNITSQGKEYFYDLPYLGRFSTLAQSKMRRLQL